MKRLIFAVLLLLVSAHAQFTVEQVMSSPFPSNLTAAATTPRVAWVFNARGVRNIWIADGPDFKARQVTRYTDDDGQSIASVRLTPDGKFIVYVRGSEINGQGEVGDPTSGVEKRKQQVFVISADGGDPRLLGEMNCRNEDCENVQLSPDGKTAVWPARGQLWTAPIDASAQAKALFFARGDSVDPIWSPDGRSIAFVSERNDHNFIGVFTLGERNMRWIAPSVDRDMAPRWSPDGKQLAFIRINGRRSVVPMIPLTPTPWAIYIADVATGSAIRIWQSTNTMDGSLPSMIAEDAFQFGNGRLLFASEQDGRGHLYSIAITGGQPTLLTPGDFDVEQISLTADRKTVLIASNQDDVDRRHIWRVALDGGKPEALSRGATIEWSPVQTADGKIVCFGSSGTSPAMPYVLTAQGRTMLAPDALPADFPAAQLVEPKQAIFKTPDGFTIHAQLFVPKKLNGRAPALIFMHGGPPRQMMLGFHNRGYYHSAYAANQYLANLGYVVLAVNYRLGIMYGRAFRQPPNAGWRGASEYRDIVAAAQYLKTLPEVDAKKIGLWGGSYGGYLTALGLARNSDLFASGVDLHGVHDWATRMRGNLTAPDAKEAADLATSSSPIAAMNTWRSPVLVIQGDDDRNVAFSQTVDLVQRLREQKIPFEQIVFPDEIHSFLLWRNWVTAYRATGDFFDRTLKKGEKIGGN